MTTLPNSVQAHDVASLVHPQTDLRRHQDITPPLIRLGRGARIFDDDGNEYIDAAGGLWCATLGYSNDRLAKVAYEQLRTLSYAHIYYHQTHEAAAELAHRLCSIAPPSLNKVLLQQSGSEANDTAVKLAWYYHNAVGKPEKRKIISRIKGYHGSTAVAASVTGKSDMHVDFNLPLDGFYHTEFPHYYRRHEPGESEEAFATRMAESLESLILDEGPETVAAFFAEPVMGSAGAVTPPRTYFEKIQAVLGKYDVLFVADEVICGFGRTGEMWGSTTYDIEPDMMSCAKGLSAGAVPISALLIHDRVYDALVAESEKLGRFNHAFTYSGHPLSAAIALEVQRIYEEMDVVACTRQLGGRLQHVLERLSGHPMVGDVSAVGFIAGIELMRDRETRTAFDPALKIADRVLEASRKRGLIHRNMGDRIAFAPPYVTTEDEIEEIALRLHGALDEVWDEVRRL